MDFSDFASQIGSALGLSPAGVSLLLTTIIIIVKAANFGAHIIPNDATGWKGTLRKICAVIGLYASSRVTSGVTVDDVAAAANTTPPIPQKVEAEKAQ